MVTLQSGQGHTGRLDQSGAERFGRLILPQSESVGLKGLKGRDVNCQRCQHLAILRY